VALPPPSDWGIHLNYLPLDSDSVLYGRVAGARSPEFAIECSTAIWDDVKAITNPCSLTYNCRSGSGVVEQGYFAHFEGVYLLRTEPANPYDAHRFVMVLGDFRSLWDNLTVITEFDWPRITNDAVLPEYAEEQGGLSAEFERTAQYRYLPRSLRAESVDSPKHHIPTAAGGKIWTAFQVVRYLLETYLPMLEKITGQTLAPTNVHLSAPGRRQVVDNKYPVNKRSHVGESFASVLERYMGLARISLWPDNHDVYLYELNYKIEPKHLGGYAGRGKIRLGNYKWSRGSALTYQSPEIKELRIDYMETRARSLTREGEDLYADMVLLVPQEVEAGGYSFKAGQWASYDQILPCWNAHRKWMPCRLMPDGTLTLEALRLAVIAPELIGESCESFAYADGVDPLLMSRLTAAVAYFHRGFRICPTWMDCILNWWTERAELTDPYTGQRPSSPVYMDHTVVPRISPFNMKRAVVNRMRAWPAKVVPRGGKVFRLDQGHISGNFFLRQVQPAGLGVFLVETYPDRQARVMEMYPGILENAPGINLQALTGGLYLSDARLEAGFIMSTVISAQLGTPVGPARFHNRTFEAADYTESECLGPPVFSMNFSEPRRIAWDDDTSTPVLDPEEGLKIIGGKPMNDKTIAALGHAQAQVYYWSMEDRLIGPTASPFWNDDLGPIGHLSAVMASFNRSDEGDKVETIFSFPRPLAPPEMWERLPQSAKQILYPLAERGQA